MATNLEYWQSRWQKDDTPWDLGGPHPLVEALLRQAQEAGLLRPAARLYVPGCGAAHDAAFFAQKDFIVTAADFVPEALAAARKTYGHLKNLQFMEDDALAAPAGSPAYDAVFDRAMLCALDPSQRPAFIAAIARRLRPCGLFLSLPFYRFAQTPRDGGPPFALQLEEMVTLLRPFFSLAIAEEHTTTDAASRARGIDGELLTVWVRTAAGGELG